MGSLTSRPQVLPVQQPEVITFTTASTPTVTGTATSGGATTTTAGGDNNTGGAATTTTGDAGASSRNANLQERSRGLLSTVLTGFDGVLNKGTAPQRKSLLGE